MQTALSADAVAAIMLSPIDRLYLCLNSADSWAIWSSTGITLKSFFISATLSFAVSRALES
jgi:hypothetical protein